MTSPRTALWLLVLVWLVPAAGASFYYLWIRGSGRAAVVLHLALVTFVLLACIAPHAGVRGTPGRARRLILAASLGTAHFALLAFHALNLVGIQYWGAPVTLEVLSAYLRQSVDFASALGASAALVAGAVVGAWGLLVLAYARAAHAIVLALAAPAWRRAAFAGVAAFVVVYAATHRAWFANEFVHLMLRSDVGVGRMAPAELFLNSGSAAREAALASLGGTRAARPRPLVLIVVDGLRSDQMGVYGHPRPNTPFLSALQQQGRLHRVDHAHSICTLSYCGYLGVLASRQWHELTQPPVMLSDVFSTLGYRTSFLLSGDHTNFYNLRQMYGTRIDHYRDGSLDGRAYINDDAVLPGWLHEIDWDDPRPDFIVLGLMSAHLAGKKDPRHRHWDSAGLPWMFVKGLFTPTAAQKAAYANNYHNGVLQTDRVIAQIFGELEEHGILDEALVVITADHGEYLGERGTFGHGGPPYEPVTAIPLLIYDPLAPAYPAHAVASHVDVGPTLLHAIGVETPAFWSGEPLQLAASRTAVAVASHETSGVIALIEGRRLKYLRDRRSGVESLFDLSADAGEHRDLAGELSWSQELARVRRIHEQLTAPR